MIFLNIISVGWNCIYESDYSYKSDKGNNCLLVLARSKIKINGKISPENTLIIYDGTIAVDYSSADDFLVCDWISFETDKDTDFIDVGFNTPISNADSEFISLLIRDITAEFYSMNGRRVKMLDFMMKTLLMKTSESCIHGDNVNTATEPHYSALIELREKIYRNPQLKWNVDTMSAYVNMSRSYFQHIYRETFGVSCMTDVISGKIEKAKEILSETGCTVSQVAAMCGYDNEEHFMRQFKKIVGVTPTSYRKK